MVSNRRGFTFVEVVVAMLILTVGVLAIADSTARLSRILNRGRIATTGAVYAQARLEHLRATGCVSLASGSETPAPAYQLVWTVTAHSGSRTKQIELISTYAGGNATRTDTLVTSVPCV